MGFIDGASVEFQYFQCIDCDFTAFDAVFFIFVFLGSSGSRMTF